MKFIIIKMLVSTKLNLRNVTNIAKNVYYGVTRSTASPTPLGRWKICENKNINLVVDYANEDHCGSCSQYSMEVRNQEVKTKHHPENDLYIYDYECLLSNTHS